MEPKKSDEEVMYEFFENTTTIGITICYLAAAIIVVGTIAVFTS